MDAPNTETLTDWQVTGANADGTGGTITEAGTITVTIPQREANRRFIRAQLAQHAAQITTWIENNPGGAQLTAAQTLVLAKMVRAIMLLLTEEYSDVAGV